MVERFQLHHGADSGDNDVTINANDDYDGDNNETIATETITIGAVGSEMNR